MQHKRGDSWSYIGIADIRSPDGTLIDLPGWSIASEGRTGSGALVQTFSMDWIDPVAQTYSMQAMNTRDWKLGTLNLDIQFSSPSGFVISTPTAAIEIVNDVTKV